LAHRSPLDPAASGPLRGVGRHAPLWAAARLIHSHRGDRPSPRDTAPGAGVRRIVTMARPENTASPRALARTEQETQAGPSDSDGPRTLKVRGPSRARSGGIGPPDLLPLAGSQLVDQTVLVCLISCRSQARSSSIRPGPRPPAWRDRTCGSRPGSGG